MIMLICLVRDSLSQCFYSSCNGGLGCSRRQRYKIDYNKKPQCKQPKRVVFYGVGTEIRAEEQKSGGQSYTVILADASTKSPLPSPAAPQRQISLEEIDKKLAAAEERRKSVEVRRKDSYAEKLKKISEAAEKRAEMNEKFMKEARKTMEEKLDTFQQNREQVLTDLKQKVAKHIEQVEEVKLKKWVVDNTDITDEENLNNLIQQKEKEEDKIRTIQQDQLAKLKQLQSKIEEKLVAAEKNREQEEQKKLEQLRNHNVVKFESLKLAQEEKEKEKEEHNKQCIENLGKKLEKAEKKREDQLSNMLENLHKHNEEHVKLVQENKENMIKSYEEEVAQEIDAKFVRASTNRNSLKLVLKEKLENRKEHAEVVRQNKLSRTPSDEQQ